MKSRKKLKELRFKRQRGTVYKANTNGSTHLFALRHGNFVNRPKHPDTSTNEFDRIDLLACLFGSNKIE